MTGGSSANTFIGTASAPINTTDASVMREANLAKVFIDSILSLNGPLKFPACSMKAMRIDSDSPWLVKGGASLICFVGLVKDFARLQHEARITFATRLWLRRCRLDPA